MGRLTGIDTVLLLDLDGPLYVGGQVVPGAPETVRWLRPGPHGAVHHQHRLDPPTAAVVDSVADLPGLLQG